jgi:hypothetical protein
LLIKTAASTRVIFDPCYELTVLGVTHLQGHLIPIASGAAKNKRGITASAAASACE